MNLTTTTLMLKTNVYLFNLNLRANNNFWHTHKKKSNDENAICLLYIILIKYIIKKYIEVLNEYKIFIDKLFKSLNCNDPHSDAGSERP